jgi:hypothetical protein
MKSKWTSPFQSTSDTAFLKITFFPIKVVRPARVELATFWFVAKRSIQLSYGRSDVQMQSE